MNNLELAHEEGRVRKVLAEYGGEIAAKDVFFRGIGGGFSGSRVFEVNTNSGTGYFLKQWPLQGPSFPRLLAIHEVQTQLSRFLVADSHLQLPAIAMPVKNQNGHFISVAEERLWELAPRLRGASKTPEMVTKSEIHAAMQSIAAIHLAISQLSSVLPAEFQNAFGTSPGLLRRRQWLHSIGLDWRGIAMQLKNADLAIDIRSRCDLLLDRAISQARLLDREPRWDQFPLPLQTCLRDLWYAHVFFIDSQVSGIIDFGSIGVDCVTTDLARLLRSWIALDDADFTDALDAYDQVRRLSKQERDSFTWFDRTSRVLSAFQWIEWLAIERREFSDWDAVSARLDFVLARLPSAAASDWIDSV